MAPKNPKRGKVIKNQKLNQILSLENMTGPKEALLNIAKEKAKGNKKN